MSGYVYKHAYILTAGIPYDRPDSSSSAFDYCKHISNLSVNKHIPGHPGQIPCDLAADYPRHYQQIWGLWGEVLSAAAPYMRVQASPRHFEFFGIDVLADDSGVCWLLEINR